MAMPLLSICIPAYNRPEWLKRAILSILTTPIEQQHQVELIVSDDSTIPACKQIVDELIVNWHGKHHYCQNTPSLGMAGNWNHCIQIASGEYVLILHDDDYLEAEAPGKILETLQQHPNESALLFGVNVVTSKQHIQKQQVVSELEQLNPEKALQHLLTDSSFIRFPGMVVRRNVFQEIGYFDKAIGGIADIQLWLRICQACGLLRVPITTANYTVHDGALTMNMFNPDVVKGLDQIFEDVQSQQWLSSEVLEKCKANYFHQFILAGTVRYIRAWNLNKAIEVFNLLDQIKLQSNQLKFKWKLVKSVLAIFLSLFNDSG
ncbi:glycosyltransferase family 2 protein [Leptolyngbyaceae cyanobacterium CCMR0081]|uniref:Glycosyltransferase family 2 protein n=2 Tax=Adonisia TaxID=2950183 RepID=A0A6M0RVN8_9CYAN|nr:glycosyltransferase family 2 protein [Adonisia turfae CCMR0081]